MIDVEKIENAVEEWGEMVSAFFDLHSQMFTLAYHEAKKMPATFRPAFRIFKASVAEYLKSKEKK